MEKDMKILFDEEAISQKVGEMAERISRDYAGKDLLLVCVLKGALVLTADLMRRIPFPVALDFVHASSYGMGTESSREVLIKKDIEADIAGRHVLLVDCIIDTGETMDRLLNRYAERRPASLRAAVLLDKSPRRTGEVPLAYAGFVIPDLFVAGYGLDKAQRYRNLPYIVAVRTGRENR